VGWDALVAASVERGYAGLEALSGIPGQVGGAPIQNVGAYGAELSDVLLEVRIWDREDRILRTLSRDACGFGYRTSRFKREDAGRFVILDVTLRLRRARPELRYPELARALDAMSDDPAVAVRQVRDTVLGIRRKKSMVLDDPSDPNGRSAGSFFTNPVLEAKAAAEVERRLAADAGPMPRFPQPDGRVKLSAAWLIERAGFGKGWSDGAVGTSSRHVLALVTRDGATAADVVHAAARIRAGVRDRFGVTLEPEPVFLGFDRPVPELLDAAL
jgi:UDP-N-acetylmuramate dehydrogenase